MPGPRKLCPCLAPVNVTAFGKEVFAGVVKGVEVRRASWAEGLNPMTGIFIRERRKGT